MGFVMLAIKMERLSSEVETRPSGDTVLHMLLLKDDMFFQLFDIEKIKTLN